MKQLLSMNLFENVDSIYTKFQYNLKSNTEDKADWRWDPNTQGIYSLNSYHHPHAVLQLNQRDSGGWIVQFSTINSTTSSSGTFTLRCVEPELILVKTENLFIIE